MNFSSRLVLVTIIFGLLCLKTSIVYGNDDKTDPEVEIHEEESTVRSDDIMTHEDNDPNHRSLSDVRTAYIFTEPKKANELVAGKLTRLLVGARNNGTENLVVESVDGSLRYPQDYSYYIQNFTTLTSEKLLEPGLESTFEYLFMASETLSGRPMGLVILMNLRNNEGKQFQNVIFNQTINFLDADEGFDGETFFLYVFLGAIMILCGFLAYQYILLPRVKRTGGKLSSQNVQAQVTKGNYDIDWIPKHHLIRNSSPKKNVRERKSRKENEVNETTNVGTASSETEE